MSQFTTDDFNYDLPSRLIAQVPLSDRSSSKMLHVKHEVLNVNDINFSLLCDLINPNDLVIFNDTKVFPARFIGHKATGGKVECMIERLLSNDRALVLLRSSKAPKAKAQLIFSDQLTAEVVSRHGDMFELLFKGFDASLLAWLQEHGKLPLPPYITRDPDAADYERYQTVFADKIGAVAAPTAGLHFDDKTLQQLEQKGVAMASVTLHVGAGTFQPVRVDDLSKHIMHHEWLCVSEDVCLAVKACRARGGRVIAIGTTVLRALEAASASGRLTEFSGETDLFITPGYKFNVVDCLLTNFHLPKSTLLMLVCAFGGYELMMSSYSLAVSLNYRFFSYGDCMFIER